MNTPASTLSTDIADAICYGAVEAVMDYLTSEVSVNAVDEEGNTPLHLACKATIWKTEIIEFLISKKAVLDTKNNSGETPMHLAAKDGWGDAIILLLKAGADPRVHDLNGNAAAHYAMNELNDALAEDSLSFAVWLLEHKASIAACDLTNKDVIQSLTKVIQSRPELVADQVDSLSDEQQKLIAPLMNESGQTRTKHLDELASARKRVDKLVAEKLKGGISSDAITEAPAIAPLKDAKSVVPRADVSVAAPNGQKTVCISGKLPSGKKKANYLDYLEAVGYQLIDDVKVGLAYLVLADPDAAGAKADKARKLGIPIISEEQLIALCSAPVSAKGTEPSASNVQTEVNRKIQSSGKIEKHNAEMLRLRKEILEYVAAHKKLATDGFSKTSSTAANLKKAFAFFEESFVLERKLLSFEKADRCASMLCGPFFTSANHPQPKHDSQFLIPFVQLDLDWINRSCAKNLPSGLLQVWCSPSGSPEIRVIPPQEVSRSSITDFLSDESMRSAAVTLIPADWGFPYSDLCSQVTSFASIGITSPSLISLCNCDYEDHKELMELIEAIEDAQYGVRTSKKNVVPDAHLFGRFAPYQTSVTDYANCEMVLDIYGIGGVGVASLLLHDSGRWEFVVCYR